MLPPSDQEALEAHLRSCPVCTSVYHQYHELAMALGNLSSDPLSSGLPPRLLEHWQETGIQISSNLSQQHRELHQITQRRSSLKPHPRRLAILGALAVVLL